MAVEKEKTILPKVEADSISRALLVWLNKWPEKPVSYINLNFINDDEPGMALASPQGTTLTKTYVRGAYIAEYGFKIVYRIQPGNSNNSRLNAMETLDAFADWIVANRPLPELSDGKRAMKFNRSTIEPNATFFARYENGDEDYQILMTLDYYSAFKA